MALTQAGCCPTVVANEGEPVTAQNGRYGPYISKGKESPFCADENESCWSQNRRGHFIITAK